VGLLTKLGGWWEHMEAVLVENLVKSFKVKVGGSFFSAEFKTVTAVDGISFTAPQGEALAFIGPNGAGKSTTIKMLTGILHPTSGSATVLGHVPWMDRERLAFKIGSVFGQKSQLWFHLPAKDTFALLGRIYEIPDAQMKERSGRLIELFDMKELMDVPVRKLSLGQRMRCEIAASLLHNPKVLFLDEPTIGLDVVAKQSIRDLIHKLNREDGVAVMLTSHDLGDVEKLCKRVIVINHGRVVYDGSLRSLQQKYYASKIIDLRLGELADSFECPGASVLKSSGYGVKLTVNTKENDVGRVLSHILAHYPVVDVNIQDPPLEEIIAGIYQAPLKADER
jgi:ABC-2 type transport system ATP-binding protein